MFGLKVERGRRSCDNTELLQDNIDSNRVERMVVSTFGSFLADSLAEWSQQVGRSDDTSFWVTKKEVIKISHKSFKERL